MNLWPWRRSLTEMGLWTYAVNADDGQTSGAAAESAQRTNLLVVLISPRRRQFLSVSLQLASRVHGILGKLPTWFFSWSHTAPGWTSCFKRHCPSQVWTHPLTHSIFNLDNIVNSRYWRYTSKNICDNAKKTCSRQNIALELKVLILNNLIMKRVS